MIKLIAIDLDGTFFHARGKVSPVNVRALEKARAKGIKVVIATGRVYVTSDPIIAPFAHGRRRLPHRVFRAAGGVLPLLY